MDKIMFDGSLKWVVSVCSRLLVKVVIQMSGSMKEKILYISLKSYKYFLLNISEYIKFILLKIAQYFSTSPPLHTHIK